MWNSNKTDQKNITKSTRRQAGQLRNFSSSNLALFSFPVHCDEYLFPSAI